MDKIKHSFNSIASKQGSYSVGLTALVIAIVVLGAASQPGPAD